MSLPDRGLVRAARADGSESWFWVEGARALDVGAAGLPDDLAAAAQWLGDPAARERTLALS